MSSLATMLFEVCLAAGAIILGLVQEPLWTGAPAIAAGLVILWDVIRKVDKEFPND